MGRSGQNTGGSKPARLNGKKILKLGVPHGPAVGLALKGWPSAADTLGTNQARNLIERIVAEPHLYLEDPHFSELAAFLDAKAEGPAVFVPREEPAPWKQWGSDIEGGAIMQLVNSTRLPVAVRAALMPDAHQGYGLPIGGVLATRNSVIPYAVGVDIACRMKLTVLDVPVEALERNHDELCRVLERNTLFGKGAKFEKPADHDVLYQDWSVTPQTKRVRQKAIEQLGSSGSGNHYASFDVLTITEPALGLEPGQYLTLLTHSGSRGPGAMIAGHYSKLAMEQHPELPPELKHLAWLDLDDEAGQEYWAAMSLMRDFAAANHDVIHAKIAKALKASVLTDVENEHNLAWKEIHDGEEVIVHRKGATPAGEGVLGIIPGSMATPAFVVSGKGNDDSLRSASHGAGRAMSRTKARETFRWAHVREQLKAASVTLLSAGIDESPGSYKDISKVMSDQDELVDVIARLDPRIVKMADGDEPAED